MIKDKFKMLYSPSKLKKYIKTKFREFKFKKDPESPFLVSFPRTGSHWLRMLIELYFEKPLLPLTFFEKDSNDFLLMHSHDMSRNLKRKNVIYLYRNPVNVVYSQIKYKKYEIDNEKEVYNTLENYCQHLTKWLIKENFTNRKIIISYEGLKSNFENEFKKVTKFFDVDLDKNKLQEIKKRANKERIKNKTESHDQKVVNLSKNYENKREEFKDMYSEDIMKYIDKNYPKLLKYFN